jgi:hypothetical protein
MAIAKGNDGRSEVDLGLDRAFTVPNRATHPSLGEC